MKRIFLTLAIISCFSVFSQHKELTISDAVLGYYKGLYPASLIGLQWNSDADVYSYQKGDKLIFEDVRSGSTLKTFSLSDLQDDYPKLKRFPSFISISDKEFIFKMQNAFITYNHNEKRAQSKIVFDSKAENIEFNDVAQAVAYTLENNIFVATDNKSKIAVTNFSNKDIVAGQAIHRSEFGITKGIFWSPTGKHLAFYQKDESAVTSYPLVDVTTYPATLNSTKYPMAGQASEQAKIGIFNMESEQLVYLNIDTSDEHYLTNLSWTPDDKFVLIAEINRAQNHVWFNQYETSTGEKVKTLFEETNDKWTEPEMPAVFLPNSNDTFLWCSERDGFMNIYQYNLSGELQKQVTRFKWVVTGILGFDSKGKNVFVQGTGDDPREAHTFKVELKSGKFEQLTKESGTHNSTLSTSGNYLLDNFNSLTVPGKSSVITTKKRKIQSFFKATDPLIDYELGTTEFVNLKSNDDTPLFGKILKPANFDPNKKYPVLIYVYGGPHAQLVTNSWLAGSSLWMPAFATLENYIVFTLDNRGSAHRGFAFESVIHRNLGDAEIEDQLIGIEYLKSLNYIDSDRMAINGWSYGGFMTTSMMLRHPGLFTTAVAGGPVTDWKYYEIMYGERYMDTPDENPKGYKKSRIHNYIKNLDGKLLLIHGSVDPVVVPQHSMTLLQEAVKNNIQVDFFTYPMHEHNVRGLDRVHLITKMTEYIVNYNK